MNEQQIKQLIQQEIHKNQQAQRFNLNSIPRHTHNGVDSPPVNQGDIKPGLRAEGSITFARQTVYKIGVNFNPTALWVHGNVTGPLGEKFMIVGNAQIGPSFYLQPSNSNSVVTGGPQQKLIQSNTYFGLDSGGGVHTLVDEGHIVNVFYGGNVLVRATVGDASQNHIYDNKSISIYVDTLTTGWAINISWTVT